MESTNIDILLSKKKRSGQNTVQNLLPPIFLKGYIYIYIAQPWKNAHDKAKRTWLLLRKWGAERQG